MVYNQRISHNKNTDLIRSTECQSKKKKYGNRNQRRSISSPTQLNRKNVNVNPFTVVVGTPECLSLNRLMAILSTEPVDWWPYLSATYCYEVVTDAFGIAATAASFDDWALRWMMDDWMHCSAVAYSIAMACWLGNFVGGNFRQLNVVVVAAGNSE